MKAEPHTHKVEINRRYRSLDDGPIEVTYGDTTVSTLTWWGRTFAIGRKNHPSPKRVRKAVVKAIRLHDEGSKAAGHQADYLANLRSEFTNLPADQWASEVIR